MKATLAPPSSLISLPRHKVSSLRSPSLLLQSQRPSSALMTTTASRGSVAVTAAATSSAEALREGIAEFYNETSGLWEEIWGDHMHHGFYDPDSSVQLSDSGHREAQIRMIEESLRFAGVTEEEKKIKRVVDVGCGIGGSSRYIASKFGAECIGITLSPVQAKRANDLAAAQSLSHKVSFQVADALDQPFEDGIFDLVWSMESGEHMPDKAKFVKELVRVTAPGGRIIIVTWCHRNLSQGEESLQPWEQNLLDRICKTFYLPAWCSTSDYVELLQSLSLQDIKCADWSENVAPFWPAVIRTALTWKGLVSLLRSGISVIPERENDRAQVKKATQLDPGEDEDLIAPMYLFVLTVLQFVTTLREDIIIETLEREIEFLPEIDYFKRLRSGIRNHDSRICIEEG